MYNKRGYVSDPNNQGGIFGKLCTSFRAKNDKNDQTDIFKKKQRCIKAKWCVNVGGKQYSIFSCNTGARQCENVSSLFSLSYQVICINSYHILIKGWNTIRRLIILYRIQHMIYNLN